MKRRSLWAAGVVLLVVGLAGVLAIGTGYAKEENASGAKCSEATLDGTYLFAYDGFVIKDNEKVPFASSGYEVSDGNGHVKGIQAVEIRLGSGSEWVAVQSNEADNDPPDPVDA